MDSTTCTGHLNKCEVQSHKCLDRLDEANKQTVEPTTTAEGPITPDSNREIGDIPFDCNSPLTAVKRPLKVCCFDSNNDRNEEPCACIGDSSPKTPKDGVFDPFAPGPDDMVLAPFCKKYIKKMRTNVARRLNFDSSAKALEEDGIDVDGVETFSDEEMFEMVYEDLLDAIVTMQFEGLLSQISNVEWDSDACKTPPLAPSSDVAAETCPNAPMKPSGKSRNIDLGLCRKLEF